MTIPGMNKPKQERRNEARHRGLRGARKVAAGGIAMGIGGYLAAQTDLEHYHSELQREKMEIKQVPETERAEVRQILREQGLDPALTETVTAALTRDPDRWVYKMGRRPALGHHRWQLPVG
jgi:hypothetical protein